MQVTRWEVLSCLYNGHTSCYHMNRPAEPSTQTYGLKANTYSVAALTQQNPAAVNRDAALGGAGKCSAASTKGAVKYLQGKCSVAWEHR